MNIEQFQQHPLFPKDYAVDMHTYLLSQTANGTYSLLVIGQELKTSGLSQMPVGIACSNTEIRFRFVKTLSGVDKIKLDAVVATHAGTGSLLDTAKIPKKEFIDKKTEGLIARSYFIYDAKLFSISKTAQFNTHVMWTRRNEPGFSYPVVRATKDNLSTTSLADATAVEAFYDASESAVRAILDSGNALKTQVNAATTVEEVNAVVDNR